MRLGFVQFAPRRLERAVNLRTAAELAGMVAADLLVLPELFDTGYLFRDRRELDGAATPAAGETGAFLVDLARRRKGWVAGGFAERDGGRIYNSALLAGPGGVVGVYRKVHLFRDEKSLFVPGDRGFPVFDLGGVRVGLMICFDWLFPEAARTLALGGAQVVAHPANLVLPFCQAAMVTRCLENGIFAVTSNRIGIEEEGGRRLAFTGRSQVVGPRGEVLLAGPPDVEAALAVAVSPGRADDKAVTPENDLFGDRRPGEYRL